MHNNNYRIIIPIRPDSINEITQYGKTNADLVAFKKKWEKLSLPYLNQCIDTGELPERFKGKVYIRFHLYFTLNRRRDEDNYTLMTKGIIDALVYLRILKDDSTEYLGNDGTRIHTEPNDDRPRVEMEITEEINNAVNLEYDDNDEYKSTTYYLIERSRIGRLENKAGSRINGSESIEEITF